MTVESVEDWKKIVDVYRENYGEMFKSEKLMSLTHMTDISSWVENGEIEPDSDYIPKFSLYRDFLNFPTLESWAKKNNMFELLSNV
jgi:hypothetical protein